MENENSDVSRLSIRDRFQAAKDKCKKKKEILKTGLENLKARLETGGNVYVSLGVIVLAIVFSIMMVTWMKIVYVEQSSKIIVLVVLLIFNLLGSVSVYYLYKQCKDEPHMKHEGKMTFLIIKLMFLLVFGYFFIGHCVLYFLKHLTSNHCPDAVLGMIYNACAIIYTLGLFIFFIYCHHRHGENTFAQNFWSVGVLLANVCIWLDTLFSESDDLFHYPESDIVNGTSLNDSEHHPNCTYNASIVTVIEDSEAFVDPAVAEFALLAIDFLFFKCLMPAKGTGEELTEVKEERPTSGIQVISTVSERPKRTRSVAFVFFQLICCACCLGFITFTMFVVWHSSLVSDEDLNDKTKLPVEYGIYTVFQSCLKFVMMCLVLPLIVSFWKSFKYKFNVWAFVLIISCFGNVVYHMFYIFALVKCGSDITESVSQSYFIFSWIDNIISIIIAWGQTLFILGAHNKIKFIRNYCCCEETIYKKSQQMFFFLGMVNLGLWVSDSVGEVRAPVLSLIPYRYFDLEFWDVMTRIILPLTIFFRFHTGLDFLKMWWEESHVKNILQENTQSDGIEELITSSN